jgi:hypothetical protein
MAGERGPLLRAEVLHHVIGEADSSVQQLAVAGGAVVGDGRLQQMAHAVKLVRAIHFGEAFGRALLAPVSVQIAAGLLRGGMMPVRRSNSARSFGVAGLQHEGHGLHPLIDVGIGIERAAPRYVLLALQAQEVIDHAVLLQFREHGGNALLHVDGAARAPESVAHFHRADGHSVQLGVRRVRVGDDALGLPAAIGGQ